MVVLVGYATDHVRHEASRVGSARDCGLTGLLLMSSR
jgi:hypothetical protein